MEFGREKALLGRCAPNHSTSLVPLYYYEITCCRRDAAIACTPRRRTSPQFRHAESRNDSYRLTPKPRITWHTGWRTARQPPSILRTVTSTGMGNGGLIGQRTEARARSCTKYPPCESTTSLGLIIHRESRPAGGDGTVLKSPCLPPGKRKVIQQGGEEASCAYPSA